jgi:hypothetical protein
VSLETYTGQTSALVATNPTDTDPKSEGAPHLRGIKQTMLLGMITTNGAVNSNPANQVISGALSATTLASSGVIKGAAGTVGLPSIYLGDDTTTGLYRIGANNVGYAVSGAKVLDIASTGLAVTGSLSATATNGNGILALSSSTGTNGVTQTFTNIGGTYTIGADNSAGGLFGSAYAMVLNAPSGTVMKFLINATEVARISSTGLAVIGNLSATGSKPFVIDHPLKPDTHKLVHAAVESPTIDVLYRGVATLRDGEATVDIDAAAGMTEGTLLALARDFQCFTTNESDWDAVRGKLIGGKLVILSQNPDTVAQVSWLVFGTRKDAGVIDNDLTDDDGNLIVEPLK